VIFIGKQRSKLIYTKTTLYLVSDVSDAMMIDMISRRRRVYFRNGIIQPAAGRAHRISPYQT